MNALSFMEILKNDGVNLSVVGENRLVVTPASRLTDSHRVMLKAHKAAILSALANPPMAVEDAATVAYVPLAPSAFPTTCKSCESFQLQTGHPSAGRCLAGFYPKETLWDSDVRWCGQVAAFGAPRWSP